MTRKTALITGITGQDGAYLSQFLLTKNYRVHGVVRFDGGDTTQRLSALGIEDATLHDGDVTDAMNMARILQAVKPDEIYNLAALSHVAVSFKTPASVIDINVKGTLNVLEAMRLLGLKDTRLYQASSSEMFGDSPPPQNEQTPLQPRSPYGAAKLAAYWLVRTYRESYGLFAANGILFNHESPLRGGDFVTQKMVRQVIAMAAGDPAPLLLGNLDAARDWGHARDYVRGMWQILQHERADDFVLATGQSITVREFALAAFAYAGIALEFRGEGLDEQGIDSKTGRVLVQIDPALFRPLEVNHLRGDAAKARSLLGWKPEYDLAALIADMFAGEREEPQEELWRKTG